MKVKRRILRVAESAEGSGSDLPSPMRGGGNLTFAPLTRPPRQRAASSIQRIVILGVTLGALGFLVVVLAWPLIVWLLSLAGITVPSLCI